MSKVHCNKSELILNSEVGHLDKLRIFLNQLVKDLQICESKFNRILLCISEAVTNAVIHGNKNNENKSVRIESNVIGNELTIVISDEGTGFDFLGIADPTKTENIKKEKGRGLYIIRFYSKEVSFSNNGSTLKIKFDLSENKVLQ